MTGFFAVCLIVTLVTLVTGIESEIQPSHQEITALINQNVILNCSLYDDPIDQIGNVSYITKLPDEKFELDESSLELIDISQDDTGVYLCPTEGLSFDLNVYESFGNLRLNIDRTGIWPKTGEIFDEGSYEKGSAGDQFSIECCTQGLGSTVTWGYSRNATGSHLKPRPYFLEKKKEWWTCSLLTINVTRDTNSSDYVCSTTSYHPNTHALLKNSRVINLEIIKSYIDLISKTSSLAHLNVNYLDKTLRAVSIFRNESVQLVCMQTNDEKKRAYRLFGQLRKNSFGYFNDREYHWLVKNLWDDEWQLNHYKSSIYEIKHATYKDTGTYWCHHKDYITKIFEDILIHVDVVYKDFKARYKYIDNWSNYAQASSEIQITADADGTVSLECKIEANPPLDIEWYRRTQDEVFVDLTKNASLTSNTSTLTLTNLVSTDEGMYMCQTKQRFFNGKYIEWDDVSATNFARFNLYVLYKPVVSVDEFIYRKNITNIELSCKITNNRKFLVRWMRVGLPNSVLKDHHEQVIDKNHYDKTVESRIKVDGHGAYICVAINVAGLTSKTIHLVSQKVPEKPTKFELNSTEFNSATLSWYSLPYMEGARKFILNINDKYNETINVSANDLSVKHSITISGLFPNYQYRFKILALNEEGVGQFSPVLTHKTSDTHSRVGDLPKATKIEFTEGRQAIVVDFRDQSFFPLNFFSYEVINFKKFLFEIRIRLSNGSEEILLLKPEAPDFDECGLNCLTLKYDNLAKSRPYDQALINGVNSFDMRKFYYKRGNLDLLVPGRGYFEYDERVFISLCFRDSQSICGGNLEVETAISIDYFKLITYRHLALLVFMPITLLAVLVYRRRKSIRRHLIVLSTIEPMTLVLAFFYYIRAKFCY